MVLQYDFSLPIGMRVEIFQKFSVIANISIIKNLDITRKWELLFFIEKVEEGSHILTVTIRCTKLYWKG